MWTTTKRVFRTGFLNFWRNGFVTLSSILMMTVTLFTLGVVLFTGVILNTTLEDLRTKADMSIYFVTSATEEDVQAVSDRLKALPEVAEVTYISPEEGLAAFRQRHANDQLTLQALEELGTNPLGAVLQVKAQDIGQYESIAKQLSQDTAVGADTASFASMIDRVDYFDQARKAAINRLADITNSAERLGIVIIAILVITTIAISFNTIRLGIYSSRDEIAVMRLVGAGSGYIRAPFMVEGVLYGIGSGLLTIGILYPLTYWLGGATQNFFGGINIFDYYIANFPMLFFILTGSGVSLGVVASFLAVRRYLKI